MPSFCNKRGYIVTMNQDLASSLGVDVQPRTPAPPPGDLVSTGFGCARYCMQPHWIYPHKSWRRLSNCGRRHDCERLESLQTRTIYKWRHQARELLPCAKPGRLSTTAPCRALQQATALLSPLISAAGVDGALCLSNGLSDGPWQPLNHSIYSLFFYTHYFSTILYYPVTVIISMRACRFKVRRIRVRP